MLINLTPHELTLIVGEQKVIVPPSGTVARVSCKDTLLAGLRSWGRNLSFLELSLARISWVT